MTGETGGDVLMGDDGVCDYKQQIQKILLENHGGDVVVMVFGIPALHHSIFTGQRPDSQTMS